MSWTRKELKAAARANMKKHYWRAVLAAFVLALGGGGVGLSIDSDTLALLFNSDGGQSASSAATQLSSAAGGLGAQLAEGGTALAASSSDVGTTLFVSIALAIGLAIFATVFVLAVFVGAPLQVGGCKWFVQNGREDDAPVDHLMFGFRSPYLNKVKVMWGVTWRVLCWSLLFAIPGVIAGYHFMMVPYLLADEPELSVQEALQRSGEMMSGQKWSAFVLDLSFLGWLLLALLTFNILTLFYVAPYMQGTRAALYEALKPREETRSLPEAPFPSYDYP